MDKNENDEIGTWLEDLTTEAKAYAENTKDYYAFVASERVARTAAGAVQSVVALTIVSMMVMLVSIAASLWMGDLLANRALGFLCVAGIYLVIWAVFHFFWRARGRERFIVDLMNSLHGRD